MILKRQPQQPPASLLSGRRRQAVAAALIVFVWILALRGARESGLYPDRFAMVSRDCLYRSAQPSGAQLRRICARYGVRTVISLRNCRPEADTRIAEQVAFLKSQGLTFVHIPSETPPSYAQMTEFLEKMKDPAVPKPVLVHCAAGRTRTGAAVALWRVQTQGWTVDAALEEADWNGLHDEDTGVMVRDYVAGKPDSGADGQLAPLIDRH